MYQRIEVPLSTQTFSAGSQSALDMSALQATIAGRIAHVESIKFIVAATPTLNSGSATIEELQKAVRSLVIKDGTGRNVFNGSFASLRLLEAGEFGHLTVPEPDAAATTEAVYFAREFNLGPKNFLDPTDFVQPAAIYAKGSISIGWGALTDVDAQCTALTLTVLPVVVCQLHDELIMGALVERFEQVLTNGQTLSTEALYAFLGLCNSSSFDALAAGDIANVETLASGFQRQSLHVSDLERMYHGDMLTPSGFTQVHGEPRAATDDNPKVPNGTAIAAASALMSPVIWSPRNAMISKLVYAAQPNLTLKWSGSQNAVYALGTRILPRSDADFGKAASLVKSGLGVNIASIEARTASKQAYRGPRKAYMPLKAKVG